MPNSHPGRGSRIWSRVRYITEHYLGYLVLLTVFVLQRHEISIKAKALLTLYYVERIEASVAQVESAQRGYLVSMDPDLFHDFVSGYGTYVSWSHNLDQAVSGDPDSHSRLQRIKGLMESKMEEMKTTIDLTKAGHPDEARQLVASRQGQRYMGEIRDELRNIRAVQEIKAISSMSFF